MSVQQEQPLRVKIGTPVIGADGQRIGDVDGVVLNPLNDRVLLIVMRRGLFFHSDQTFSVNSVTHVDDDGVHVSFTREDADQMDRYMDADFLTPPDGYFATSGVFWPSTNAFYSGRMNAEEQDMEAADPELGGRERLFQLVQGTDVLDRAGESLGKIAALATDPHGRITAFRVDQGRFHHTERWVPIHLVAQADEQHVHLNLTLAELNARCENQAAFDPEEGFILDVPNA